MRNRNVALFQLLCMRGRHDENHVTFQSICYSQESVFFETLDWIYYALLVFFISFFVRPSQCEIKKDNAACNIRK